MAHVASEFRGDEMPSTFRSRRQGLRMTILLLLVASLIATGFSVAGFFVPGAVVAAIFVAIFYALLVAVKMVDRHEWIQSVTKAAKAGMKPSPAPGEDAEPGGIEVEPDLPQAVIVAERAGFRMGLVIAVPLAALAVLLAAVFVGWKVIGLGALLFFAFMILIGAPVWLAAMEDQIEEAEEEIGIKTEAIR